MTIDRGRYAGSALKRAVDSIVKDDQIDYVVMDENGREIKSFASLPAAVSFAKSTSPDRDVGIIKSGPNGEELAEYDRNGRPM